MVATLQSHVMGAWHTAPDAGAPLADAVTGAEIARISSAGVDFAGAVRYARTVGGPALRALTFRERAALLKDLAKHLNGLRDEFHALSFRTGATRRDSSVDIDGGTGTLLVYAGKGAKELPDATVLVDGAAEPLERNGTFAGQHLLVPRHGVAVQINAFNFPVWGMLEKLAPAFLAGMPSIVKPAARTAYLTELVFRRIVESGILPPGSAQLICGGTGDLLDHLDGQDIVSFTGSAATARVLRTHDAVAARSVRFNAEADSLNCAILGPDATPGTPEFDLYADQLVTEMTVKAGQKCTAIRRAFVPRGLLDAMQDAVTERLARVVVGHPEHPDTTMGALAGLDHRDDVRAAVRRLTDAATLVFGDPDKADVTGADDRSGAFLSPLLLRCDDPDRAEPHEIEAFGPVGTLMPYDDTAHAATLAARGAGSLVGSVVSADPAFVRDV
ncbi:MAG: phenylacetic acid degradation bifunctional protein PaaZ, partial [Streptomycetaceae bacterium]|nr:phenylacetic acid degradation bifunctional protein PaaZ [Streptomycetaceae bacterium]